MEKIDKLNFNFFPESLKRDYELAKTEWENEKDTYINDYTEYIPGTFFSPGYDTHRPDVGKVRADRIYGKEFDSFDEWSNDRFKLTSTGQQQVVDKINEIINYVNSNNMKGKKTKSPTS